MGKSNQALKAVKYEAHNQNSITNETSPGKRDIQAIHFLPKLWPSQLKKVLGKTVEVYLHIVTSLNKCQKVSGDLEWDRNYALGKCHFWWNVTY